jgi:hypothetical protein
LRGKRVPLQLRVATSRRIEAGIVGERGFMRRGRAAAQSEWRLVTATHNMLTLHTHWIANTA